MFKEGYADRKKGTVQGVAWVIKPIFIYCTSLENSESIERAGGSLFKILISWLEWRTVTNLDSLAL